jgi:hypothetical protein
VDDLIDELVRIEQRCRAAADLLDSEVKDPLKAAMNAANEVARAWSQSWLGYQSCVYYAHFERPPRGAVFSIGWGLDGFSLDETRGDWQEFSFQDVIDEILRRAGNPDLEELQRSSLKAQRVFTTSKEEVLATLDALLASAQDSALVDLRASLAKLNGFISEETFAQSRRPGGFMSNDVRAMEGGIRTPPHIAVESRTQSLWSPRQQLDEVERIARQTRLYLQKRIALKETSVVPTEGTVFIGHGRSKVWKDLKEFLQDRLHLTPDEFNLQSAAGMATTERLQEMLDSAVFAFLVMTAEDEHADSTKHARENSRTSVIPKSDPPP